MPTVVAAVVRHGRALQAAQPRAEWATWGADVTGRRGPSVAAP
jgi:hypothetical protein